MMSQFSVATDDEVEDGLLADADSDMQLSMSQTKQVVGSLLLKCWIWHGTREKG